MQGRAIPKGGKYGHYNLNSKTKSSFPPSYLKIGGSHRSRSEHGILPWQPLKFPWHNNLDIHNYYIQISATKPVTHGTQHYKHNISCHLWHAFIEQDSQRYHTHYPVNRVRGYRCKSLRFTLVLNPEMEVLNFHVTDIQRPPYWSLSCPPTQGHSLKVQTTQI